MNSDTVLSQFPGGPHLLAPMQTVLRRVIEDNLLLLPHLIFGPYY